ncbi:MAG: hypothetical protein ACI4E1_06950 [Lachnospira sp.]
MKRTVFSILLILILCCGVTVGCNHTNSDSSLNTSPSSDNVSATIDGADMVVSYSSWNGKDITFSGETLYLMMYPLACEMDVNSNHLITFEFYQFNPTIKREEILLSKISSTGERYFIDSISNITEESNELKIELKFDEENPDDKVIFVLSFYVYWDDEYSGEVFVSMRSL